MTKLGHITRARELIRDARQFYAQNARGLALLALSIARMELNLAKWVRS